MMMRALRKQKNQSASLINDVLYSYLTQGGSQSTDKRLLWPMLSAVCLCIVAMAGPTTQKIPKPVYDVAQAKVIVLDLSLSMRSTDIAPDRLTRMSFKAIDLINANNGGEIGLIAYAGDAFVISPITSDGTNLNALIPGLSPEIMPEFGSSPDLALMKADEMLTQAGYLNGDIIWFTDGVDYDQIPMLTSLLQRLPTAFPSCQWVRLPVPLSNYKTDNSLKIAVAPLSFPNLIIPLYKHWPVLQAVYLLQLQQMNKTLPASWTWPIPCLVTRRK